MIVYFNFPTMMLIAVACLILGWVLGFRQGRKRPPQRLTDPHER